MFVLYLLLTGCSCSITDELFCCFFFLCACYKWTSVHPWAWRGYREMSHVFLSSLSLFFFKYFSHILHPAAVFSSSSPHSPSSHHLPSSITLHLFFFWQNFSLNPEFFFSTRMLQRGYLHCPSACFWTCATISVMYARDLNSSPPHSSIFSTEPLHQLCQWLFLI